MSKISPRLAIPIRPKDKKELLSIAKRAESLCDLIEVWGDKLDQTQDFTWTKKVKKPIIFCLKDAREKGEFKGGERKRVEILEKALEFCDFVDLGICTKKKDLSRLIKKERKAKIILSFHDFEKTPPDLEIEEIFENMKKFKANLIKIALKANSFSDSLRLLLLAEKQRGKGIFISMGKYGQINRVFSALMTNTWTYASLDEKEKTAEGQFTVDELRGMWGVLS